MHGSRAIAVVVLLGLAGARGSADAPARSDEPLPKGFVRGDVVSYSYVPNRTWLPKEALGKLPYLFEYSLLEWDAEKPLEAHHRENVRRIDIAAQWSTAIMLTARRVEWRDELINLMLRCYRHRQLIVLANYHDRARKDGRTYGVIRGVLEKLWAGRDRNFTNPEGDRATGRQLINNILANKCGDEGESGLRTEGLRRVYDDFDREVRMLKMGGEQPFRHIKAWYNMIGYAALDFDGAYAASREDVDRFGRMKLPQNTQCIGVDVYHYWGHGWSPFDPADLSVPRTKVRAHSDEWQRLRTRYYPAGLKVRVGRDSNDPKSWVPEFWNDTHALMGAIELADARHAMMWYIAVCGQIGGPGLREAATYTTPIETMDAYYDELKAGPWSALAWWVFGDFSPTCHGGLEYYDRTLLHFTPAHPEGEPYSAAMLDYWHDAYVAHKRRLFEDVVYNQFGYLNGPRPDAAR